MLFKPRQSAETAPATPERGLKTLVAETPSSETISGTRVPSLASGELRLAYLGARMRGG